MKYATLCLLIVQYIPINTNLDLYRFMSLHHIQFMETELFSKQMLNFPIIINLLEVSFCVETTWVLHSLLIRLTNC